MSGFIPDSYIEDGERKHWKFPVKGDDIYSAAKIKLNFHQTRLKFWEDKQKEIMKTIKDDGLEFDESLSDLVSNKYKSSSISIRNDLVTDFQETKEKVHEHRHLISLYDSWVQLLEKHTENMLDLCHSDWIFFYGTK